MSHSRLPLDTIASAIADGRDIDWNALRHVTHLEEDRRLLSQFEVIGRLAAICRRPDLPPARRVIRQQYPIR